MSALRPKATQTAKKWIFRFGQLANFLALAVFGFVPNLEFACFFPPAIVFSLGRSHLNLPLLLVDRSPLRLLLVGCGRLRWLLGLAGALHVVRRRLDQTRHETLNALGP